MKVCSGKKWAVFFLLCLWAALLGGCSIGPRQGNPPGEARGADGSVTLPEDAAPLAEPTPLSLVPEISPHADAFTRDEQAVSLYFRMRDDVFLAQETRVILIPKDKQYAQVLIESLIEGPSASSMDLTSLFIPGTKVVDVTVSGQMLTVTLSRTFLGTPVDAPMEWEKDPVWRREVLLRRKLALASIANTITEETACTSVQLLIQFSPDYPEGERINRSHLEEDAESNLLLTPVFRDEQDILTHYNTAVQILSRYMEKDFSRLHSLVAGRPTETAFVEEMANIDHSLVSFTLTPGTVSPDGQRAIVVARLGFIAPGDIAVLEEYPIDLVRERGIWKIPYETLLRLLEAV